MERKSFSRTKVELFTQCPRCFYLEKLDIKQPQGFPFTINNAIDALLKKEFDYYRERQEVHPIVKQQGFDFVPMKHSSIDEWRSNRKGIRYTYKNYDFFGAVDDVWLNADHELVIVDYKATASQSPIKSLDRDYHEIYKRQIEFYQWLFKMNGFKVSDTAYFVYCTGNAAANYFNGKIDFSIQVIPHTGSLDWVENRLDGLIACYESLVLPDVADSCNFCQYTLKRSTHE